MSITVTLSHDKQTLETLRDEWIDLQTRSSATGMDLSWQMIYVWYKYFGDLGELWIMTARQNERLIGIAPLIKKEEKPDRGFAWQQLEFIGAYHDAEHLDFIIEHGYEEQVIPLFIDKLYEHRSRWDVILLTGLCDTKTPDILHQSDHEWIEYPEKDMIAPYLILPDTVDEWMESLSSARRRNIRRGPKSLDKQFPDRWSITQVTQSDELDNTFDHLVRLHQARWEAVGELGTFNNKKRADFYRELAHYMLEQGWLRLYRLDIDDEPCAVDLCYCYRGRTYGHLTSNNREITNVPLGMVLKYHSINQAIYDGCHEITLGEGEQAWKYSFGGIDRVQKAFRLIGSPRVRLQLKTVDLLRGVKSQLREVTSDTPTEEVDES